jgi:hypothetical protein
MKKQTFIDNKYGKEKILHIGQKVECIYYHEYKGEIDSYKRTLLEKFIDKPFSPVKLGIIVGDAGIHPYWLAGNERKERYLLVKFKEYFFAKPIPISCITDAEFSANRMDAVLKENEHRIGEKGFSKESFENLKNQNNKTRKFLK